MRAKIVIAAGLLICCCLGGRLDAQDYEKHIYDSSASYFDESYPGYWYTEPRTWQSPKTESSIKQWKSKDGFWYMNDVEGFTRYVDSVIKAGGDKSAPLPSAKEAFEASSSTPSGGFDYIFFLVAVVIFLAAIVYFMASNKVGFFAREAVSTQSEITVDELGENIFALQYKDMLQKALKDSNYRLAVRIMYLQTLKQLNDSGLIRFQPELTNIDYLLQLKSSDKYRQFALITNHYEYVWYGKFELSKDVYERISNDFITMQNTLG